MQGAKAYICDLSPYQPGLPVEQVARQYGLPASAIIKLASNENPLGMSPKAAVAVRQSLHGVHRYPEQYGLVQALANHYNLNPATVVLGNGSNDVLDLIARTYLGPGDEAVSSQYAFAVYPIATQSAGATNVVVPAKQYGHDLKAMRRAITPATKIVWLANPNNPTGTFIPYPQVKQFVEQVPPGCVVVLDEAYYEYLAPEDTANTVAWLSDHPNLILVRTFSKIYGLAGLRIGYGLAAPHVVELLNRVRQPFNCSVPALAAATAALGDTDFVAKSHQANLAGRTQLLDGLQAMGLECLPAYGNFVTFKLANALQGNEELLKQGVIVRPLKGSGLADWLRVSVGTQNQNQRFLKVLKGLRPVVNPAPKRYTKHK